MRSGRRAILPSSFMISQITPEGFSPASRAMSVAASVWPARTRTPPSRARSGKMWPGVAMSAAPLAWSMATETVRARSCALMPVETPSRASMETVKAVSWRDEFCDAISGRPSASIRSPGSVRQIRPRPCVAIKLIASGVAICAGMTRSPSFSRSSWSTRMNMRPLRASSMTSSMEEMMSLNPDSTGPGVSKGMGSAMGTSLCPGDVAAPALSCQWHGRAGGARHRVCILRTMPSTMRRGRNGMTQPVRNASRASFTTISRPAFNAS